MRVAAQGDAEATLGRMHYDGDGGPQDLAEARQLYGLAAAQGYAEAQCLLGYMHRKGEGGPCLLYTSPSPRDPTSSRMPSSA